jgi:glycosyltransferase involved in cell wall biosynthesis
MRAPGPSRVIHVITRLDLGGAAQNTLLTAIGHDRNWFIPTVVTGLPEQDDPHGGLQALKANLLQLEQAGVRWRILSKLGRPIRPVRDFIVLLQLAALFRRERPQIVHTHTSKAGALGRLASWLVGVPVVVHTPHGHVFYGHFGKLASWICVQIERGLAWITTRLIALTEAERDEHLQRGVGQRDQFAVIPSGIELDRFVQVANRYGSRPEGFDCPPHATVIGSVGWLTPVKGHRVLLEAVALLRRSWPDLYVVIVGDGPLRKELMRRAGELGMANRLRLLGMRSDIPDCLAGMDVYVQPSLNEGMGRALVEAMAAGRPVVASRVGGIPSLIEHRRTGLLVPPGDPEALAHAIAELLEHPELARALGAQASESIEQTFSVSAMVRAVEAVYEACLVECSGRTGASKRGRENEQAACSD